MLMNAKVQVSSLETKYSGPQMYSVHFTAYNKYTLNTLYS